MTHALGDGLWWKIEATTNLEGSDAMPCSGELQRSPYVLPLPSSTLTRERRLAYYGVTGGPPGTCMHSRTGLSGNPFGDRWLTLGDPS